MMLANNRKATLQAIHSDAVNRADKDQKKNIVFDGLPHPVSDSEKDLFFFFFTRKNFIEKIQQKAQYNIVITVVLDMGYT